MPRTARRRQSFWSGAASLLLLTIGPTAALGSPVTDAATPLTPDHDDGSRLEISHHLAFDAENLCITDRHGYAVLRLGETGTPPRSGEPALSGQTICIALPAGMRVMQARAGATQCMEIAGSFTVRPAQFPQPISGDPVRLPFIAPDPTIYSSVAPYPPERVAFVTQADLAGQSIAFVRVDPVQWIPATGELSLATEIEIVLAGEPGYICGDYLPASASPRVRSMYERMLRALVINPRDVRVGAGPPELAPAGERGVAPGSYDYVIVTRADWVDDFQPLADWRTRQGLPATIVTTEWIYGQGGYGGTLLEQTRAFIADAHDSWGATYFLLGGDTNVFPYHIRTITVPGYGTDDIPNYTYYADYDEDWVCEVHLGNASVRTAADIATFIEKVLVYEKSPPLTDYATRAAFFGFDISTCGDGSGEIFKEDYIRAGHLPPSWALSTEYDSEPGSHKADVIAYLNEGHHLVNHHDHCNSTVMGTGWICHSQMLEISDVTALTNGERRSILFAVGCNPADFPVYTSIGEAFLRHTTGGAVAFMGNTRTGWGGSAGDPDHYSLRQDRFFYRNLFDHGIARLGENFTLLKNDEYDPYDPHNLHQYCFTQLHLLGDPGMPVWTDDPAQLTVGHPQTVNAGVPSTFEVEVSEEGAPLDGATVCLWKTDEVYQVAQSVGGSATFDLPALTEGVLLVTVTLQNCLPYEGEALVETDPAAAPEEPIAPIAELRLLPPNPNLFCKTAVIRFAIPPGGSNSRTTLGIYDCTGQRVRLLADRHLPAGIHHVTWNRRASDGRALASGIYFCRLQWSGQTRSQRVVLLR